MLLSETLQEFMSLLLAVGSPWGSGGQTAGQSGSPLHKDIWVNDLLKRLLGRSIDSSNWGSISQECFLSALAESSNHPSSYLLTIRTLDLWLVGNSSNYYCTRPELRCVLRDSFCWTMCFTVFCCHILLRRRCPNKTYSERGLTNHSSTFQDCQDMANTMQTRDVKHIV